MFNRNKDNDQLAQLMQTMQVNEGPKPTKNNPWGLSAGTSNPWGLSSGNSVTPFLNNIKQQSEEEMAYVQQQLGHYKQRLEIAGFDPEKAADGRNIAERFLGLPDNQNWILDILELVGRPKQAVFGALQTATDKRHFTELTQQQRDNMTGDQIRGYNMKRPPEGAPTMVDAIRGAIDGLTGKERFTGGQVVRNIFSDGAEKDGFGWEDVAGFGLEMVLDPVRLALWAKSGGASEALRVGSKAAETATGIVKEVEGAGKAFTLVRDAASMSRMTDGAKIASFTGQIAGSGKLQAGEQVTELLSKLASSPKTAQIAQEVTLATAEMAKASKEISRMPQFMGDIAKIVKGEQISGRLDAIRNAESLGLQAWRTGGALTEVVGKVTNPNYWLFSETHNLTHMDSFQKGLSTILGGASKLAAKGIDWGTNNYMKKASALMETDPQEAYRKARNYLELDESIKKLMSKVPQFTKRTKNITEAEADFIKLESQNLKSDYLINTEKAYLQVKDIINPDTGKAFIESPEHLQRMIYDLTEANRSAIETSVDGFVRSMVSKKGVGLTIPSSLQTDLTMSRLFGDTADDLAKFGVTKIGEKVVKDGVAQFVDGAFSYKLDPDIWNHMNTGKLVSDISRRAPDLGEFGVVLGLEVSDEAMALKRAMGTVPGLAPVLDTYNDFHDKMSTLQEMISGRLFDDPQQLIEMTKKNFGEGYIPHSLNVENEEFQKLDDLFKKLNQESKVLRKRTGMTAAENIYEDARENLAEALVTGEIADSGLRTKSALGDTRAIQSREMPATTYMNNKVMKDYLSDLYGDPETFLKHFPNSNLDEQAELLDQIRKTDWFHRSSSRSLLDMGFEVNEGASQISFRTQLALGHTFGGTEGNYDGLRVVRPGERVPIGLLRMNEDDARNVFANINSAGLFTSAPEVGHLSRTLDNALKQGHAIYVDETIHGYITSVSKLPMDRFLDNLNDYTNKWKKMKVLSPAYQMRNVLGNLYNANASGINIGDALAGIEDARKRMTAIGEVNKEGSILYKYARSEKLTPWEQESFDIYREMRRGGFLDSGSFYELQDIRKPSYMTSEASREGAKIGGSQIMVTPRWEEQKKATDIVTKTIDWASDWNMRANQAFDDWSRVSTYMYGKNNPAYLKSLGVDNAIDAVRRVHFDVTDLTYIEDKYIRKLIPFYNFNRQNLKFQFHNLLRDPKKFYDFNNQFRFLWNVAGVDIEDMKKWERENYYLPIPIPGAFGADEEGDYQALKADLPVSALMDYSTPSGALSAFVASLNPLPRAPFEIAMGKKAFTGEDIKPGAFGKAEYVWEMTGLDMPARVPQGALQALMGDPAQGLRTATSMISKSNLSKTEQSRQYDELHRLKEFFEELRKQGIDLPTITELRRAKIIE